MLKHLAAKDIMKFVTRGRRSDLSTISINLSFWHKLNEFVTHCRYRIECDELVGVSTVIINHDSEQAAIPSTEIEDSRIPIYFQMPEDIDVTISMEHSL